MEKSFGNFFVTFPTNGIQLIRFKPFCSSNSCLRDLGVGITLKAEELRISAKQKIITSNHALVENETISAILPAVNFFWKQTCIVCSKEQIHLLSNLVGGWRELTPPLGGHFHLTRIHSTESVHLYGLYIPQSMLSFYLEVDEVCSADVFLCIVWKTTYFQILFTQ